jgi:hypothetical protein
MKAEVKEYEALGGFKETWTDEETKYDMEVLAKNESKSKAKV